MGISSANHSGDISRYQCECSPLSAWAKKCGFFFLLRGSQRSLYYCKRAGGPNLSNCLSVMVSGKENAGIPAGIPGAGENTKLPVLKEKGWLLFSTLLFFSLTYMFFFHFCRYQKYCSPSERFPGCKKSSAVSE